MRPTPKIIAGLVALFVLAGLVAPHVDAVISLAGLVAMVAMILATVTDWS